VPPKGFFRYAAKARLTAGKLFAWLLREYMLNNIAPQSSWSNHLENLLMEYPEIPKQEMDFPEEWKIILFGILRTYRAGFFLSVTLRM